MGKINEIAQNKEKQYKNFKKKRTKLKIMDWDSNLV